MGIVNLPTVFVRNLGKMCYSKALFEQNKVSRDIIHKVSTKDFDYIANYLLIVEHDPVYTVGIRNKQYVENEQKLKELGAAYVVTDRGGLITFHGPGQLVCYPVLYLGSFNSKKSIKWYVRQLENTLIDTCNRFGLVAQTTSDVGVWIGERKIAAIGIHASRYVTTHGIALNCNVDLDWFSHIVPCGIEGKEVTSLSKELQHDISVEKTIPNFLLSFQKYFPCRYHYENGSW